jgi:hypothetical protein
MAAIMTAVSLISLIWTCVLAVSSPGVTSMGVPADWTEVKAGGPCTFRIPKELVATDGRGIDSQVQIWQSKDIVVKADFGRFSDPLTFYTREKGYETTTKETDSGPATIVSFERKDGWHVTAIHFPEVERDAFGRVLKLTLYVETLPDVGSEVPIKIVHSVGC